MSHSRRERLHSVVEIHRYVVRNKRTPLKEAEQHVSARNTSIRCSDALYVLEKTMRHFFIRAEMGKNAGRDQSEVDADYKKAAHLAALVAPYRHARLSAMKLAGDPNNPVRIRAVSGRSADLLEPFPARETAAFVVEIRKYVVRNKRTPLKEAEQHVGSKYVDQVLDALYVLEKTMRHFFIRAEMGKNAGRDQSEVDADYKKAAAFLGSVGGTISRHARLSAMKLAGDPNNPVRIRDDATADELRAEITLHIDDWLTAESLI